VGDHVVQLAGDPQALLGRRLPGLLVPFPLQPGGPVLQLSGVHAPLPDPLAQDPRGGQQHVVVDHVGQAADRDLRPLCDDHVAETHGEQRRPHRCASDGQPTVPVDGQRVQSEIQRQEGEQGAAQPQNSLDPGRRRDDGEHRERGPPPQDQGQGLQQHQCDVEGAAVARAWKSLQLRQRQPGSHQCQQPVCHQGVQSRQPGTDGAPSVHGQTLAVTPTMRITLGDDRHTSGFITKAEAS
jgi:hypothetical protein